LIEVNLVLSLVPSPFTTAMIASEMPAAIRPYSMAVAAVSSARNRRMVFMEAIYASNLKGCLIRAHKIGGIRAFCQWNTPVSKCSLFQIRRLRVKTGQYPSMLDALEDYVKRQKKRLGIAPAKKEAAN
jgi:hypothetical protein